MTETKPKVGLLLGDPSGIGPELVVKLLADASFDPESNLVVVGDRAVLDREAARLGVALDLQVRDDVSAFDFADPAVPFLPAPVEPLDFGTLPMGTANEIAGGHTMRILGHALDLVTAGAIDAVAYAPMNKKAMNLAGFKFRDGLDFCTSHLGYDGIFSELNILDHLWVARVTSHVPMKDVTNYLTTERVHAIIDLLHRTLVATGIDAPRISVAGYNPHCGEGGLCGTEEIDAIIPAIERARADGMAVDGPLSADIVYIDAQAKGTNGIVAMYHDQCQIANKLLEFDRGVVIHGGSPAPTVTTAHGTAYDIVGQDKANPKPLARGVKLAARIAHNRALYEGARPRVPPAELAGRGRVRQAVAHERSETRKRGGRAEPHDRVRRAAVARHAEDNRRVAALSGDRRRGWRRARHRDHRALGPGEFRLLDLLRAGAVYRLLLRGRRAVRKVRRGDLP